MTSFSCVIVAAGKPCLWKYPRLSGSEELALCPKGDVKPNLLQTLCLSILLSPDQSQQRYYTRILHRGFYFQSIDSVPASCQGIFIAFWRCFRSSRRNKEQLKCKRLCVSVFGFETKSSYCSMVIESRFQAPAVLQFCCT